MQCIPMSNGCCQAVQCESARAMDELPHRNRASNFGDYLAVLQLHVLAACALSNAPESYYAISRKGIIATPSAAYIRSSHLREPRVITYSLLMVLLPDSSGSKKMILIIQDIGCSTIVSYAGQPNLQPWWQNRLSVLASDNLYQLDACPCCRLQCS
jgi:hypothetical protein